MLQHILSSRTAASIVGRNLICVCIMYLSAKTLDIALFHIQHKSRTYANAFKWSSLSPF